MSLTRNRRKVSSQKQLNDKSLKSVQPVLRHDAHQQNVSKVLLKAVGDEPGNAGFNSVIPRGEVALLETVLLFPFFGEKTRALGMVCDNFLLDLGVILEGVTFKFRVTLHDQKRVLSKLKVEMFTERPSLIF